MSFLTVLGNYLGGRGQARQQSYENSLEAQRLKQEGDYNKAQLAEQQKLDAANLRASGIDPSTGQPFAFTIPKALQQVAPGNKGQAASPEQYVQHYLGLAAQASQQNRPDLAKQYSDLASQYGLGAERAATAAYTAGPKSALGYANVGLADARAAAERDLPQRAREIAKGHDQAQIQKAGMQIQAAWNRAELSAGTRSSIAQLNNTTRMAVANLAGAYHLTGLNAEDATKAAIADFTQKEINYRQATSARQLLLGYGDPNAASPDSPQAAVGAAPVVNNYIGSYGPGGYGGPPTFPGLGGPGNFAPGAGGATNPATDAIRRNTGTPPNVQRADPMTVLQKAAALLKSGTSPHDLRQFLNEGVQKGKLDAAVARQIETQLGIGVGGGLAPPPVGGSQTARPF